MKTDVPQCCRDAGGLCPQHADKARWPLVYRFYGGKRRNDDDA